MLLHPTLAAREPVPGEEQGTHLEPCAFCATANGATALTCWRCGARLQHGRLEELVSARHEASPPTLTAEPLPSSARPPAGVPIPTLYPSFTAFDPNATVPMTVALGLLRPPATTADEPEMTLDMAKLLGTAALGGRQLADPQASTPQAEPGTDLVVATPVPFTRKQRTMLGAGIVAISVAAVFAGSSLLDHYQTGRVGSGWSTASPHDATDKAAAGPAGDAAGNTAANTATSATGTATGSSAGNSTKLGEDPAETLRSQPTAAGAIEPVSTTATAATATATATATAAALVPLAVPATAAATAAPTTTGTVATTTPVLDSTRVAPADLAAAGTATSGAGAMSAAPLAASEPGVRRRNPSRSAASRYAAVRRDAADSREPAADRVAPAPASPRPCTPGVAALGLCTP